MPANYRTIATYMKNGQIGLSSHNIHLTNLFDAWATNFVTSAETKLVELGGIVPAVGDEFDPVQKQTQFRWQIE